MSDSTQDRAATDAETDTTSAAFEAGRSAAAHRGLLGVVGGVSIIAGFMCIMLPFLGTLTAAVVAGAALIASGLVGLFTALRRHDGWHLAATFGLSILSVVTGLAILIQPLAGILALTTLVIAWFAASGVLRIYYGARMMGEGGGWMIAAGAVSVIVAGLLWFSLPFSATWVLGVLLGIDLMLWGALIVAFAVKAGRMAPATA